MLKADAALAVDALKKAGFSFAASLPATQIHTLCEALRDDPEITYVPVTNEGEGVSICAGAWLGGRMPVMVMETSGILVATYALLRLHTTFGVPTLMLSTYRGDLGEQEWYAVHTGAATPDILKAMRIPTKVVSEPDELPSVLLEARRTMDVSMHPISVMLAGRLTRRG